jgi:hypothetical protein
MKREGSILSGKKSEGSVVKREGSVMKRESSIFSMKREGSVMKREGSILKREGSIMKREGSRSGDASPLRDSMRQSHSKDLLNNAVHINSHLLRINEQSESVRSSRGRMSKNSSLDVRGSLQSSSSCPFITIITIIITIISSPSSSSSGRMSKNSSLDVRNSLQGSSLQSIKKSSDDTYTDMIDIKSTKVADNSRSNGSRFNGIMSDPRWSISDKNKLTPTKHNTVYPIDTYEFNKSKILNKTRNTVSPGDMRQHHIQKVWLFLFVWLLFFTYALLAVVYVSHVEDRFFKTLPL